MTDREDKATHWVARRILDGDWHVIQAWSLALAPVGPECVKAAQEALDIYYQYLGYDPKEVLL